MNALSRDSKSSRQRSISEGSLIECDESLHPRDLQLRVALPRFANGNVASHVRAIYGSSFFFPTSAVPFILRKQFSDNRREIYRGHSAFNRGFYGLTFRDANPADCLGVSQFDIYLAFIARFAICFRRGMPARPRNPYKS